MHDCFALHYVPEAFTIAGQKLMGPQSAGVGLLGAIARDQGLREVAASPPGAAMPMRSKPPCAAKALVAR